MLFLEDIKNRFESIGNIFEIGAHVGMDVPKMLEVWPDAQVYAFEADPHNYEACYKNIGNDKNTHLYNVAVTDYTGTVSFNRFFDVESVPHEELDKGMNFQYTGQGSVMGLGVRMKELFRVKETVQKLDVPCTSLVDFCSANSIPSIDALFMDVQGAEQNVLNGCSNMLRNTKAVVFEWSTNILLYEGETDFLKIKQFLEDLGFYEHSREYQLQGISGDSLFLRK